MEKINFQRTEARSRSKLEEELGLPPSRDLGASPSAPGLPPKANEPIIARLLDAYLSGKVK